MEEKKNKTSAAQLAASRRYQAQHTEKLTVSARKGTRQRWQAAADAAGARSLTNWIISTLDAAAQAQNATPEEKPQNKTE